VKINSFLVEKYSFLWLKTSFMQSIDAAVSQWVCLWSAWPFVYKKKFDIDYRHTDNNVPQNICVPCGDPTHIWISARKQCLQQRRFVDGVESWQLTRPTASTKGELLFNHSADQNISCNGAVTWLTEPTVWLMLARWKERGETHVTGHTVHAKQTKRWWRMPFSYH